MDSSICGRAVSGAPCCGMLGGERQGQRGREQSQRFQQRCCVRSSDATRANRLGCACERAIYGLLVYLTDTGFAVLYCAR